MALNKYNGFVPGDKLPAENVNSVDPNNIESPVANEAFRIIRANEDGLLPSELLVGVSGEGLIDLEKSSSFELVPSANLRTSADAVQSSGGTSVVKKKEILFNDIAGTIAVYFELANTNSQFTSFARIYKNGVAYGTQRSEPNASYVGFTENLAFVPGDLIQLYIWGSDASTNTAVRNFRLSFDKVPKLIANTVNLN